VTLPQPKLVLDLATLDGCKSELTWVEVICEDSLLRNTAFYLRNSRAVSSLGILVKIDVYFTEKQPKVYGDVSYRSPGV